MDARARCLGGRSCRSRGPECAGRCSRGCWACLPWSCSPPRGRCEVNEVVGRGASGGGGGAGRRRARGARGRVSSCALCSEGGGKWTHAWMRLGVPAREPRAGVPGREMRWPPLGVEGREPALGAVSWSWACMAAVRCVRWWYERAGRGRERERGAELQVTRVDQLVLICVRRFQLSSLARTPLSTLETESGTSLLRCRYCVKRARGQAGCVQGREAAAGRRRCRSLTC